MKKYLFLLLACVLMVSGCGKPGDIHKIYAGYSSFGHILFDKNYSFSFIKDALPSKTFLCLVSSNARKVKKYYFKSCGLLGPQEVLPEVYKAVCYAANFRNSVMVDEILLFDLEEHSVIKRFLLTSGYRPILIRRPRWADDIFVLIYSRNSKTCLLRKIDLHDNSFSNPKVIGSFSVENAFFMEKAPFLILDVVNGQVRELIVYDIKQEAIVQRYLLDAPVVELKESDEKDVVYGLFQMPGELKSKIMSFGLKDNKFSIVAEIDGELESMLVDNNIFYVIGKDHKRRDKQSKYWLYPRNLYIIDRNRSSAVEIVNWTKRQGKFLGMNPENCSILYAVTDNDAPGIWVIKNSDALLKVKRVIR
ncbi:MAG: hypothetical protein ABIC68_06160 [Candidatus Omnitrophota bacterium]